MRAEISHNNRSDCPQMDLGDWRFVITGSDYNDELKDFYIRNLSGATFYDLLGLEMHSQQQGQSTVFYRGLRVTVERMEDTSGSTLLAETILVIGGVRLPLALVTLDFDITFED